MASVSIALSVFMLVAATATAFPTVLDEKSTNQGLINAFRYRWNEGIQENQNAEIMNLNLWNKEEAEKGQNKDEGSDSEDGDKDGEGTRNVKGDSEDKNEEVEAMASCTGRHCHNSSDCCPANSFCLFGFCA